MSVEQPIIFQHSDLAVAWGRLFNYVMLPMRRDLRPTVISIGAIENALPSENQSIRIALDSALATSKKYPVDVTAMTIFPYKSWLRLDRPKCAPFSDRCIKQLLPRLRALDRRNQYGIRHSRTRLRRNSATSFGTWRTSHRN